MKQKNNLPKISEEIKQRIASQRYLYRGTCDLMFDKIKEAPSNYYIGYSSRVGDDTTSTSMMASLALIAGNNRWEEKTLFHQGSVRKATPLFLAINSKNYFNFMREGIESSEIEILGGVDYLDITVVDSMEKFLEFCGNHLDNVSEVFGNIATKNITNYFKQNYLKLKIA